MGNTKLLFDDCALGSFAASIWSEKKYLHVAISFLPRFCKRSQGTIYLSPLKNGGILTSPFCKVGLRGISPSSLLEL